MLLSSRVLNCSCLSEAGNIQFGFSLSFPSITSGNHLLRCEEIFSEMRLLIFQKLYIEAHINADEMVINTVFSLDN